jgi:hypothetical protein
MFSVASGHWPQARNFIGFAAVSFGITRSLPNRTDGLPGSVVIQSKQNPATGGSGSQ